MSDTGLGKPLVSGTTACESKMDALTSEWPRHFRLHYMYFSRTTAHQITKSKLATLASHGPRHFFTFFPVLLVLHDVKSLDIGLSPTKFMFFLVDQKYTIETRVLKVSQRVYMYMGINYLLFICFWWGYFDVFLTRIPFRNMHNVLLELLLFLT